MSNCAVEFGTDISHSYIPYIFRLVILTQNQRFHLIEIKDKSPPQTGTTPGCAVGYIKNNILAIQLQRTLHNEIKHILLHHTVHQLSHRPLRVDAYVLTAVSFILQRNACLSLKSHVFRIDIG